MKHLRALMMLALCLLTLAAIPASAQESPLGVPLSPEQTAALPEALRSDPRAIYGAIHITGFDQLGCNNFDPVARITVLVPGAHEGFVIRSTISRPGLVAMNERTEFVTQSGSYPWILGGFTTGGTVNENWPLTINVGYTLSMMLLKPSGEPLWYTEAEFSCNGAPSFTQSMSTPVRVVNVNPDFNKEASTPKLAAKWAPVKAVRTCAAVPGDCAMKMTAKVGKTAQITQNKRFKNKPVAANGDVFGLIVVYNTQTTGFVPGTFKTTVNLNGGAQRAEDAAGQTFTFFNHIAVPQTGGEIYTGMIRDHLFSDDLTKLNINVSYSADQKSAVFVRAVYFWVADTLG